MRKSDEESKDGSSSNKKNSKKWMVSGSSTSNSMKDGSRSKMTSGSKQLCGDTTEKKNQENGKTKARTSLSSCEEMVSEVGGYRWDAILLSETWRPDKSEIWETHHKHMFMGAGKI